MIELVRDAEAISVQQIVQLEKEAFGTGGLNEWQLVPFIRHGRVFVTKRDDHVAGVVQFMLDWENPCTAYVFGISVDRKHRGQGIGSELLRESIVWLKREGIKEVELTVDPRNQVAVRMYETKFGFVVTEKRDNEYGKGEDRLVMKLVLAR